MTAEDFGGDPMSVSLKEYFDTQFKGLEDRFDTLCEDIKKLPCGEYKGMILQNTQRLDNGEKAEEDVHKSKTERLTVWRIGIAIIGVAIVVLETLKLIK